MTAERKQMQTLRDLKHIEHTGTGPHITAPVPQKVTDLVVMLQTDGHTLGSGAAAGHNKDIDLFEFSGADIFCHEGHKFRLGGVFNETCQMKKSITAGAVVNIQAHTDFLFLRSRHTPGTAGRSTGTEHHAAQGNCHQTHKKCFHYFFPLTFGFKSIDTTLW